MSVFRRRRPQDQAAGAAQPAVGVGRSNLPTVTPSVPYGQAAPIGNADPQLIHKTFAEARDADDRNETSMAVRLYEMVAAPYLTSRDTSLLTPELGVALARTAELAEQDGSYRFAAERFNEASRVFTAIAATAARQGNQKASKMAEAEADETQQRAKRAASEQSRLQEKQDRMLAQEGQLKARQFEDFARHLGRS